MSEFIESIKHRIRSRMDELRPLVEEARQLEAMLDAINSGRGADQVERIAPTDLPELQTQPRSWGATTQRVPQSERLDQFIAVVRQNPSASVAQISQKLGVSPNRGYQLVNELERQGRVERGFGGFVVKEASGEVSAEPGEEVDDKTRVMRMIARRPMISGRDLANALDLSPERLFQLTSDLEREGRLTRIEGSFLASATGREAE